MHNLYSCQRTYARFCAAYLMPQGISIGYVLSSVLEAFVADLILKEAPQVPSSFMTYPYTVYIHGPDQAALKSSHFAQ
eukprot:COSAG05_NODE_548_length_8749_cov_33.055838_2_plen_78_part_00